MAFGALSTLSKPVLSPVAAAIKRITDRGGLPKKGSAREYISSLEKAGFSGVEGGPEFLAKLAATEGGLFQDLPLRRADIARYTEGLPLIEEPSVAGTAQFIREGVPEVDPSILADMEFEVLSYLRPSPSEPIDFDQYLGMAGSFIRGDDSAYTISDIYADDFLEDSTIPEIINYAATTGEQLGRRALANTAAGAQKNLDASLDLISSMQSMMESDGSVGKNYSEGYFSNDIGRLSKLADDLQSNPDTPGTLRRVAPKRYAPDLVMELRSSNLHRAQPSSAQAPLLEIDKLNFHLRHHIEELDTNVSRIAHDQAELHTVKWGQYSPYGSEQLEAIQTFPSAAAGPFQFRLPLDPSAQPSSRQGTAPYS